VIRSTRQNEQEIRQIEIVKPIESSCLDVIGICLHEVSEMAGKLPLPCLLLAQKHGVRGNHQGTPRIVDVPGGPQRVLKCRGLPFGPQCRSRSGPSARQAETGELSAAPT